MAGAKKRIPGTWAVITSVALALLATGCLLLVPTYAAESTTVMLGPEGRGAPVRTRSGATLLEVEGWSALIPVLIPVMLTTAPLLVNRARYVLPVRLLATVLLLSFVVVAGFSIGLFYLPSAFAMLLAAIIAAWRSGWMHGSRLLSDAAPSEPSSRV